MSSDTQERRDRIKHLQRCLDPILDRLRADDARAPRELRRRQRRDASPAHEEGAGGAC